MPSDTVVYSARKIITMNPSRPSATHVAVREGRIVATGSADELVVNGARLDTRFADKVLMPGFVEGHSHIMEGLMWREVDANGFLVNAFADTVAAKFPMYVVRGTGGLMYLSGALIMVYNIYRTIASPEIDTAEDIAASPQLAE